MVDFSNLAAVVAAAVGLIVLAVGRVPIPGRSAARGVLVRLAGAALLLPWPAAQGLAFMAKAAREMDGNPPDKPETFELIKSFVQLVLLFGAGVTSLVLILLAATRGRHGDRRRGSQKPNHSEPTHVRFDLKGDTVRDE